MATVGMCCTTTTAALELAHTAQLVLGQPELLAHPRIAKERDLAGCRLIDNDGVHTARTTTQTVELTGGRHSLQLDYFQEKKGTVALQRAWV